MNGLGEKENFRLIEQLHGGESYSQNLLNSGLLTDDTEWWAAGPADILPWAGMFRGREAIARWFKVLNDTMEYFQFEPFEQIAKGDTDSALSRSRQGKVHWSGFQERHCPNLHDERWKDCQGPELL